jgi:hypothetical protein
MQDRGGGREPGGRQHGRQQGGGDHNAFRAKIRHHVVHLWMDRDGKVGGDGPRRRGPDQDREWCLCGEVEPGRLGRGNGEADPDRGRDVVAILDLRLGERGLEGDAPVDRLLAAVDEAPLDERGKGADNVRLERRILRLVLVFPVGQHAEALELTGLGRDPALGKRVAFRPELSSREDLLLRLQFAGDLLLDRQPVAVPAGHEGGAEAPHRLVPVEGVLEHLVERGADVDVPVGEGRAVVQDERAGRLAAPLLDAVVKP